MNKDKLFLKDGTQILLESGAMLSDIKVLFNTKTEMLDVWEALTPENLSEVQIKTNEELTIGIYQELILVNETSVIQNNGIILTSFCLREKTDMERRMDSIEEKLEVHDGAIMDAAEMISSIAEEQEGGTA